MIHELLVFTVDSSLLTELNVKVKTPCLSDKLRDSGGGASPEVEKNQTVPILFHHKHTSSERQLCDWAISDCLPSPYFDQQNSFILSEELEEEPAIAVRRTRASSVRSRSPFIGEQITLP